MPQALRYAIALGVSLWEMTRSKRTPTGSKLRVASLRVAMPQALRCAIDTISFLNWAITQSSELKFLLMLLSSA